MDATVTEVWQQVRAGLRSFIVKRVTNEADVDDILQEVFLRMHRRIKSLRDPRRVVSWVYQITRRAVIDHYRAQGHRREVLVGLGTEVEATGMGSATPFVSPSSDSVELRWELSGCVRPMIERLAKEYGEALALVELEGLPQHAAAEQLGLSLSGMKSRIQRGRKQLKQMLDDCCIIELDRRHGVIDYEVRDGGCNPCGGSLAEG
jgi:RNA polymerase sigma-70 factor (ECF subfamily)